MRTLIRKGDVVRRKDVEVKRLGNALVLHYEGEIPSDKFVNNIFTKVGYPSYKFFSFSKGSVWYHINNK